MPRLEQSDLDDLEAALPTLTRDALEAAVRDMSAILRDLRETVGIAFPRGWCVELPR